MGRVIAKLNSLIDYEKKGGYTKSLEPFLNLLESLGNPHLKLKNVIHIVGTKGKGSVSHIISRGLINAGYRVGLFTSPHLVSPLERIRVNEIPISEGDLGKYVEKILKIDNRRGFQTYFEILTASAIMYFLDTKTDFNVFEAGLGGRLDATNVLNQDLVVITRIDYDHMHILGNTLEDICREKSAVIKGEIPVITTKNNIPVMHIIKERAKEFGAEVIIADWELVNADRFGIIVKVDGEYISAPLLGEFQAENLALAYKTLKILGMEKIDFSGAFVPGRLHVISKNPHIILDGAHNVISISSLLKSLKKLFPEVKFNLVISLSSDKEIEKIIKTVADTDYKLYITRYPFPRATDVESLFKTAYKFGKIPKILTSIPDIISLFNEGNTVITGSFYLVGEVMSYLKLHP